ncbi:MAG: iron ABC transporter permease [Candidatus Bathyarchaeota archaeon]|nr:iron ABC transporter permease [Candidatus Bathyarchaeota archaeon]
MSKSGERNLGTYYLLLVLMVLLSLFIGRYSISYTAILDDTQDAAILWNLRLPRVLTAAFLGMVLAVSGATFQSAFRNPLVGPDILGISQGASFGAAVAILYFSGNPLLVEISATVFALIAFTVSYRASKTVRYGDDVLRLILSGLVVSAFFSGGVGVMKSLADPLNELPELTFWLLGGLSGALWGDFLYMLPFAAGGLIVLYAIRWRINLLSLDDEVATSLGVDPKQLRRVAILAAVVATAAVTSVSGTIGWIGLLAPHIARKLVGVDTRYMVPVSGAVGGGLMVFFDDIARSISPSEIPLGVVVSFIGAPFFLYLLSRRT